jgi:hypothetical protein
VGIFEVRLRTYVAGEYQDKQDRNAGDRGEQDEGNAKAECLCKHCADGWPDEAAETHGASHCCHRSPSFTEQATVRDVGLAADHPGGEAHTRGNRSDSHNPGTTRQGE